MEEKRGLVSEWEEVEEKTERSRDAPQIYMVPSGRGYISGSVCSPSSRVRLVKIASEERKRERQSQLDLLSEELELYTHAV